MIYNNERLHWSLELKTPQEVHRKYNQQPINPMHERLRKECW
jgi:hypothetical protein